MLDLTALYGIVDLDRPDLKAAPWTPVVPVRLLPPDDDEPADVFAAVRAGDILVHHPYESFAASVERFITQAADDPDVLTIKQTLYRTSGDSPIVQSLIRAAERGKQVVVLVEIKARFDEEANIIWARKLERAGAHVVYGLVGLKTHSQDGPGRPTRGLRPPPLRPHRDGQLQPQDRASLRGPRPADGPPRDRRGRHRPVQRPDRPVAPAHVPPAAGRAAQPADRLPATWSMREVAHAAAGRPARIVLKTQRHRRYARHRGALCGAAEAGVDIDLIIRGACSLQPGVPGISERIRVRSIIGEFLEHSRIWRFENGGDPQWFIGSADLMDRNLDRRVEAIVPVEDTEAKARLQEIIDIMLADDRRSWQLLPGRDAGSGPRSSRAGRARSTRSRRSRSAPSRAGS